jgi:LEA14-like dessication related protein
MKGIAKGLGVITGIIVLLLLAAFIFYKTAPEKVYALLMPDITNIRITGSQVTKAQMHMNIEADLSKKVIPFFLDSVRYKGVLYGDTISRGTKNFKKEKEAEGPPYKLSLPVTIAYQKLLHKMKKHQGDSAMLGLMTVAYLDLPLIGNQKVDLNKEVKFKMIVFPEVKIDKIEVENFGFNNMKLKIKMLVSNPNDIDFKILGMKYNLKVGEYLKTEGQLDNTPHIKAHGTSPLEMEVKSDIDKPFKAIWKAAGGKKEWPYTLKTDMTMQPSVKNVEEMKIATEMEGNVNVAEAIKKKL